MLMECVPKPTFKKWALLLFDRTDTKLFCWPGTQRQSWRSCSWQKCGGKVKCSECVPKPTSKKMSLVAFWSHRHQALLLARNPAPKLKKLQLTKVRRQGEMLGVCAKANLKKDEPCCFLIGPVFKAQTPSSSAGQEPSATAEEVAAGKRKSAEARPDAHGMCVQTTTWKRWDVVFFGLFDLFCLLLDEGQKSCSWSKKLRGGRCLCVGKPASKRWKSSCIHTWSFESVSFLILFLARSPRRLLTSAKAQRRGWFWAYGERQRSVFTEVVTQSVKARLSWKKRLLLLMDFFRSLLFSFKR